MCPSLHLPQCCFNNLHVLLPAQVAKLEEIYGLKKYVPSLTHLDLSGNALGEDKSYRCTQGREREWEEGTGRQSAVKHR